EPALDGRERRLARELRRRIVGVDAHRHQVEVLRPHFGVQTTRLTLGWARAEAAPAHEREAACERIAQRAHALSELRACLPELTDGWTPRGAARPVENAELLGLGLGAWRRDVVDRECQVFRLGRARRDDLVRGAA